MSLLIPHAYVSVETIDCTLLPSFELKAILLVSSEHYAFTFKSLLCFYY